MKILLIGHSIIDHLENQENAYPGGVYYSTLGFLSYLKPNDRLALLTGKNSKSFALFEPLYSKVDLSLSDDVLEMPEVFLHTSGKSERREVYKNIAENLSLAKLENLSQFDGILINMVTGFDISLTQLKWLRESYTGLIYLDVHTLSRGLDENRKREFRPIPNIEEWLSCIDFLQCNESELKTIYDSAIEESAAEWILHRGVKTVIITKAKNGVAAYFRKGEEIDYLKINGEKIVVKNTIGCGDVFGATFFSSYIRNRNNKLSLEFANHAGAVAASTVDLYNCTRLPL
ncbi:MAG: carbohydrate kinase family protein [Ignavibacteriales bacterium]|nr:carbohydrate kinase family protein [Ignavibacteriales bacterium]